jgi:hypothetical protein
MFLSQAYADHRTCRKRRSASAMTEAAGEEICKPRANCLKPKEIAKPAGFAPRDTLTYGTHRPLLFAELPARPSHILTP